MRPLLWLLVTGGFAALNFWTVSRGEDRGQDTVYSYEVLASAVIAYGILALVVYALTTGLDRREVLALRAPASWWRALGLAAAGAVAAVLGAAALLALTNASDEQNLAPEDWDGSRAGAYAASFLAIVVIGPLVEELLYRGAGIGLFLPFGTPAAIGVTAIVFGFGHGLLLSLPALVWFGVVTGWLRVHTRSVYPAVVAHALFNAFGMIAPLVV